MRDKKYVTYEEFGAVGDGKHDDFEAIYKAHEYANANMLAVKGRAGATYYIENTAVGENGEVLPAIIMTDVDWQGANFIIDDTGLKTREDFTVKYSKPIFLIKSRYDKIVITDPEELESIKIPKGTKNIDLGDKYKFEALLIPEDDSNVIFRRYGYVNRIFGESTREVIVVDKDGNVRDETPVIYDYKKLSKLTVHRIDVTPITVEGATFTTIKPRTDRWVSGMKTAYIVRGLKVYRSNVTVKNVKKYNTGGVKYSEFMRGELAGCAYDAFYSTENTTNVTFKDCVFTANMSYGHSTYIHTANYCNKIVYDHCVMSNFWIKIDDENDTVLEKEWNEKTVGDGYIPGQTRFPITDEVWQKMVDRGAAVTEIKFPMVYWGSGGSNFCKNLEMINGTSLSRFDAHQGLYNGVVRDSVVSTFELIGTGNEDNGSVMLVENSSVFTPNVLAMLRGDYGGTWQGKIIFKNTNVYLTEGERTVISKTYKNWYFGYETYVPDMTFDNVAFFDVLGFTGYINGERIEAKDRPCAPISDTIYLFNKNKLSIPNNTRMHLKEAHIPPCIEIRDNNGEGGSEYTINPYVKTLSDGTVVYEPYTFTGGDGYIDEPWDMDGDGKIGNLMIDGRLLKVSEIVEFLNSKKQNFSVSGFLANGEGGMPKTMLNFNITHAPGVLAVINNEAGHKWGILKTSGFGVPSTDTAEDDGGFFGTTKFYYEDDKYLLGTDYTKEECENTPFIFE